MARTHEDKMAAADAIAQRLADRNRDEDVWQIIEPLRPVADAFREQVAAEAKLIEAVKAARKAGCTWAQIAAMLGTSKQTAQHRFGKVESKSAG